MYKIKLYDFYQLRVDGCDMQIEQALAVLKADKPEPKQPIPKVRHRTKQTNAVNFDVRTRLYQFIGVDLTQIHRIGPFWHYVHLPSAVLIEVNGGLPSSLRRG